MSGIYWTDTRAGVRLTNYGAVTKGEKSVVKIELAVTDPDELSYILRQCAQEQAAGKAKPKKLLALPDFSEGGQ